MDAAPGFVTGGPRILPRAPYGSSPRSKRVTSDAVGHLWRVALGCSLAQKRRLECVTIDSNLGKVDEVMTALYDIHDPEIGMSIVDLDLIKAIEIGADGTGTEIKMVLTTPFCPWAGELIQSVKTKAEEVVGPPVKVTLLAERWEPPPGLF